MSKANLPSETKALKDELRTILTYGPFRTAKDRDEYRLQQKRAMADLDQAVADTSIGATEAAEILISSALRRVKKMRAIIEKGRK